jgi:hypothetical protein
MNQKEQTSSFADRARLMQAAVEDLRAILAIVEAEAKAMAAAHTRFATKTSRRTTAE